MATVKTVSAPLAHEVSANLLPGLRSWLKPAALSDAIVTVVPEALTFPNVWLVMSYVPNAVFHSPQELK